jgi:hypothetical protein
VTLISYTSPSPAPSRCGGYGCPSPTRSPSPHPSHSRSPSPHPSHSHRPHPSHTPTLHTTTAAASPGPHLPVTGPPTVGLLAVAALAAAVGAAALVVAARRRRARP